MFSICACVCVCVCKGGSGEEAKREKRRSGLFHSPFLFSHLASLLFFFVTVV